MKLLFAGAELAPWVKTGGLGDVMAALPPALARAGADLRLLLPAYPALRHVFSDARPLHALPSLAPLLPPAQVLDAGELAPGLGLWLLDAPSLYARSGHPYLDAQGSDWADNVWRFGLLSHAAAHLTREGVDGWRPDLLHTHDWHAALAPALLKLHGCATPSVMTVHNLAFQGLFPHATLGGLGLPAEAWRYDALEFYGQLSFLKAGLQFADALTTVSPRYAQEIQGEAEGCGLDGLLRYRAERLLGIVNGIDEQVWNPASDPCLVQTYDADRLDDKRANTAALKNQLGLTAGAAPLLGVVSRITHQKGADLIAGAAPDLLADGAQFAVLGSGDAGLVQAYRALAQAHPGAFAFVEGYDEALAHRIEAGADVFLMPSRFEPCGLNQLYSQRYGTPPLVRRTGGLADTVTDATEPAGTGFLFDEASVAALLSTARRALALRSGPASAWRALQQRGMATDFSWRAPAARYLALYTDLLEGRFPPSPAQATAS